jgi:hypothetical protein
MYRVVLPRGSHLCTGWGHGRTGVQGMPQVRCRTTCIRLFLRPEERGWPASLLPQVALHYHARCTCGGGHACLIPRSWIPTPSAVFLAAAKQRTAERAGGSRGKRLRRAQHPAYQPTHGIRKMLRPAHRHQLQTLHSRRSARRHRQRPRPPTRLQRGICRLQQTLQRLMCQQLVHSTLWWQGR